MATKKEKLTLSDQGFWQKWISKLLFTFISVKLWGLIAATWVSTYLLTTGNPANSITGTQWVTFNTTIWALIFGMKEVFRISEQRDRTETENLKEHNESKARIASILATPSTNDLTKTTFMPDGKEIVGEEPDSIL